MGDSCLQQKRDFPTSQGCADPSWVPSPGFHSREPEGCVNLEGDEQGRGCLLPRGRGQASQICSMATRILHVLLQVSSGVLSLRQACRREQLCPLMYISIYTYTHMHVHTCPRVYVQGRGLGELAKEEWAKVLSRKRGNVYKNWRSGGYDSGAPRADRSGILGSRHSLTGGRGITHTLEESSEQHKEVPTMITTSH